MGDGNDPGGPSRAALGNVALRIVSQVLRLGVSFYVIGLLGLHAAGIYGLALGAIAIAPALIGWGLNYHLTREIAGRPPAAATPLVRDRLVISLLSLAGLSLLAVPATVLAAPRGDWPLYALILALIWLETISLDLFVALLAVERSFLANFLVLIRSALWALPVVGFGLADPRLRTLEFLLAVWIGFHLLALAVLAAKLRRWGVTADLARPIGLAWAAHWLKRRWFIYLSDLGYVGLLYLDRYLVLLMLGLTTTAIYTFYWALANAVQTIVLASVVQVGRPRLVVAASRAAAGEWRSEMRSQLTRTCAVSLGLAALGFGATTVITLILPPGMIPSDPVLFALLLGATVLRCCSEVLNSGLISRRRDGAYAAVNLSGLTVTLVAVPLAALAGGVHGVGAALAIVAAALLALRVRLAGTETGERGAA